MCPVPRAWHHFLWILSTQRCIVLLTKVPFLSLQHQPLVVRRKGARGRASPCAEPVRRGGDHGEDAVRGGHVAGGSAGVRRQLPGEPGGLESEDLPPLVRASRLPEPTHSLHHLGGSLFFDLLTVAILGAGRLSLGANRTLARCERREAARDRSRVAQTNLGGGTR